MNTQVGPASAPFFGRRFSLYCIALLLLVTLDAAAQNRRRTPPAEPRVRPNIARSYPNDPTGRRIDDDLFNKSGRAATPAEQNALVEVELVFTEQVTQAQIDRFIAEGGVIDHIFEAVSYGWVGKIPLNKVRTLPQRLGATMILVQESKPMRHNLMKATQTGRVRPVWASSFNNGTGYDGTTNITIAIIDSGVDETHADLNGRRVYWKDFSGDGATSPVDYEGHGSHVAGIATGTGLSGGSSTGTLYFTTTEDLSSASSGTYYPSPIEMPTSSTTWISGAKWSGGSSTVLRHIYNTAGIPSYTSFNSSSGTSPISVTDTITPNSGRRYSATLTSVGGSGVGNYVITNSVTSYPSVGDGFNRFSGVAPGCNWAGAKVENSNGSIFASWVDTAIDTLVSGRSTNKIKVMNISLGVGSTYATQRQKVNTAVNNGIVVVVSAGNDGSTSGTISDPARAAKAITVAGANSINQLTYYTSLGFTNPGSTSGSEEDYKPDVMAPGGSSYYSYILSVDSNTSDTTSFSDVKTNDYTPMQGTSMAAPFVTGSAALIIDAMEANGYTWDFNSSDHSLLVKMLLNATATESNTERESFADSPTLQRNASTTNSYPVGKDPYEGYGMINPDAAVEAVLKSLPYNVLTNDTFGSNATDRRAWARKVTLTNGMRFTATMTVPGTGDFDLYLYEMTPGTYGKPTILASSCNTNTGTSESFTYTPDTNRTAFVVAKRISGSGTFNLGLTNSNDAFTNAWTLNSTYTNSSNFIFTASTSISGNNTGFTTESGEHSQINSSSAWFNWTAPFTGTALISCNRNCQVFTGSAVSALTSVGSQINSTSNNFSCTAGNTYRIAVFGTSGSYTLNLSASSISSLPLTNSTLIASNSAGSGAMSPYPSQITIVGVTQTVTKVTATLLNITHTAASDLDIGLIDPSTNSPVYLMSDAGTGSGLTNVTLTFDDSAASILPSSGTITSGTWRPADYTTVGDRPASPAPTVTYNTNFNGLVNTSPTGTWSLYAYDDGGSSDAGNIAGGWALKFTFNQPPSLFSADNTVTYVENANAKLLQSAALITDSDSTDFNGGSLTVQFTANGQTEDRLSITNAGTGSGKIGVSGSTVTYGGVTIGTYAGGSGTTPLVITFNSATANPTSAAQLISSITYSNASDNPVTSTRTVQFTLNDGDGGNTSTGSFTETVNITAVNDAPLLTLSPSSATFVEHAAAVIITGSSTVSDVDSTDFNTGSLIISNIGTVDGSDRIFISSQGTGAGQIGVSGTNVSYGGTAFGNYSGGTASTPLIINFTNTSATPTAAQALVNRIAYTNSALNPTPATRTVKFVLADGDGGSVAGTNTIAFTTVNDAPTITFINALTNATEDTAFTISNVTLTANSDIFDAENSYYGYRIVSVTAGTLTLNGSAVTPGTTTFWPPDSVVWTPATNTFGTNINAFVVQAYDSALASTNSIQVRVAVAAVNDAPTLTTVNTLTGANQDTAFAISYTTLTNAADEADVENDALSFRVEAITSGTLRKNGTNVVAGSTLLSTGETWSWTPATNVYGSAIAAFTVRAWDGKTNSLTAIAVSVTVTQLNHSPVVANGLVSFSTPYGAPFTFTHATNVITDVDTNQTLSYSATGLPPGISYNSGTRQFSGSPTASGSYASKLIGTDNGVPALSATNSFTFTVNKTSLTVTPSNTNRLYGATNPVFTGTITGLTNSDNITAVYATTATTNSAVGTYPITATLTDPGSKLTNYTTTTNSGTLTVNKATLLVAADNVSRSYGATNPVFTVTYTGFTNGETLGNSGVTGAPVLSTSASTNSPVGSYVITNLVGTLAAGNYSFTTTNGTLTIGKAPITLTAASTNKIYGATNPVFTATYGGFVNGEDFASAGITGSPLLSSTLTTTSPPGTYTGGIVVTNGTLSAANYVFTNFVSGTFTISNGVIVATADNASRAAGSANPVFTGTLTGVVGADGITAIYSTAATTGSPVGTYPITVTLSDPNGFLSRYGSITLNSGTLTVTNGNVLPVVTLTIPTNNAVIFAGDTNTVTATASDSDGTVSKVEFYWDTTKFAESTISPYTVTWTNLYAGTFSLTARATDNSGGVSTSAVVTVTSQVYLRNPLISGNDMKFTLFGRSNQTYVIYVSTNLSSSWFSKPGLYTITNGGVSVTDTNGATSTNRFYKAIED